MIKLKLIFFGKTSCISCLTHVSIIITDEDTKRSFIVNYPFESNGRLVHSDDMTPSLYGKAKNTCCISVTHLYSNKDFNSFIKKYNEQFSDPSQFSFKRHNCANAVNMIFDHFFPNEKNIENCCLIYKSLCCIGWVGSCGLLACIFPAPPCIESPRDIFAKAKLYTRYYGQPLAQSINKDEKQLEELPRRSPHTVEGNDPVNFLCNRFKLV